MELNTASLIPLAPETEKVVICLIANYSVMDVTRVILCPV